jgi:hypothetical protein
MKRHLLPVFLSLLFLQVVSLQTIQADTGLSTDTLNWSWEVSTTTSTQTKTCTFEYSGQLLVDWGDGAVQTIPDTMSGKVLTHVYAAVANYNGTASGAGISYFKADSRRLLSLDPTKAPNLSYLSCTGNMLDALTLQNNTELVSLYCGGNNLTALNVTGCTKIQTLTCSDNLLTTLDVSVLSALKKLTCHTNSLTSLNVCPTGSLSYVSCLNCSLQVAALDTLFARLPTLAEVSSSKNLYVLNNPGSASCAITVATAKKWTPDKVSTASSFYIPDVSCVAGDSAVVSVYLSNPVPVMAFELDMIFPDGFELDTLKSGLSASRKGGHLLSIARTSADSVSYKFLAYSMANKDLFKGTSGPVLELYLKVPKEEKAYTIQIKQAILVDTATNTTELVLTNGTLTVESLQTDGDVNGDNLVNVTDIVYLVACINGSNPVGIDTLAADMDGNGILNVVDITKLVVVINDSSSIRSTTETDDAGLGTQTFLQYDAKTATAGNHLYLRQSEEESLCLELCMDNKDTIQAYQVDIVLPEGLSLETSAAAVETLRNNGQLLRISEIEENRYRILSYALKPDAAFLGNNGALAVLPLNVAAGLSDGSYPVYLEASVLTDMARSSLRSSDYGYWTTIGENAEVDTPITVGTDGQSNLWVHGSDIREVTVWDTTGRILFQKDQGGVNACSLSLRKGIYLVRVRSDSFDGCLQKIVVR